MYILQVIKKSIALFNGRQRFLFLMLLAFFLVSAVIQIAGVASIGPFIAVLSDTSIIHKNSAMSFFYELLDLKSDSQFIVLFGVTSMALTIFSNAIAVLTLWLLTKFSITFGADLQSRLFLNFVGRSYVFHKSSNYSTSIAIIAQEAPRFVYMVLQPMLLLFSNLFVAVLILTGLLVLNPSIAIGLAVVLGGAYLGTYLVLKKSLSKHGGVLTRLGRYTQMLLSEAFMGIKDIILNSLGGKYANNFRQHNMEGLRSAAFLTLSGDIPKFVIEAISFACILLLAIVLLLQGEKTSVIVSMLSVYALAGYKLLPTLQQLYKSVSALSAHGRVPFDLYHELSQPSLVTSGDGSLPLDKVNQISLAGIGYSYPESRQPALKDVHLRFDAGKINTIAGHSGSGKSTLIDIVLGLLQPSHGHIDVDGRKLEGDFSSRYQKSIGYVPQSIFLLDDDVIANVAFGADEVDLDRVKKALSLANAMEFVNELPQGLHSKLGQDGKMLSGGQRQRIGIARSLYRNNRVLILDEPTSALDIESEYEFIQLLAQLKKDVLIIVISHRPAAIKCSDNITLLEKGSVIANGTLANLMETNEPFKDMMEKGMMLKIED